MLVPLSSIATKQAAPTAKMMAKVKQLLDYVATQKEVIITFNASDMILSAHSNTGYCNEKKARSQAGGHFILSNNDPFPPNNGAILTTATIIKNEMSSVAEVELGALYINAKEAVYLRQLLLEIGHPQPPTPIQTDNMTAEGVINNTIQSKARSQFQIFWRPGGQTWRTTGLNTIHQHITQK
jgi:hypothetical protein